MPAFSHEERQGQHLWRAGGIGVLLVEIRGGAGMVHIGHESHIVLEIVGAVVKHRVAQRDDGHLQ